jgi:hypothetical protein
MIRTIKEQLNDIVNTDYLSIDDLKFDLIDFLKEV